MSQRAARWSDGDRYFGPFTFGISESYRLWAMVLTSSGQGDSNDRPAELRINLGQLYLIITMPNIIRPHRRKVYPGWDWETVERLGRDWYWDADRCGLYHALAARVDAIKLAVTEAMMSGALKQSAIERSAACAVRPTIKRKATYER